MTARKQTVSFTEPAFDYAQTLVDAGEYPSISAAVSGEMVRAKAARDAQAALLAAEVERRLALPIDRWEPVESFPKSPARPGRASPNFAGRHRADTGDHAPGSPSARPARRDGNLRPCPRSHPRQSHGGRTAARRNRRSAPGHRRQSRFGRSARRSSRGMARPTRRPREDDHGGVPARSRGATRPYRPHCLRGHLVHGPHLAADEATATASIFRKGPDGQGPEFQPPAARRR